MRDFIVPILLFFCVCSYGQTETEVLSEEYEEVEVSRVHFFEGNFSMYFPLDAFANKIDKSVLYGFSLGYLMQLQKEKPSFFGYRSISHEFGIVYYRL